MQTVTDPRRQSKIIRRNGARGWPFCVHVSASQIRDHLTTQSKLLAASCELSVSAVVMSYLQNPQPIIPPWASFMS
ncbi:hypothetical protein DICVIV_02441 [Dictyocaulus viviparus]|uniref:Uncharacterized protein n=1 Tax=Dictyocaulus viviparus TaxID=29172 RepID=A0A0D8Y5G2_DICVI|nr:hypothetical protein DICVIV_02441 [Dictyocaulus viviparus]